MNEFRVKFPLRWDTLYSKPSSAEGSDLHSSHLKTRLDGYTSAFETLFNMKTLPGLPNLACGHRAILYLLYVFTSGIILIRLGKTCVVPTMRSTVSPGSATPWYDGHILLWYPISKATVPDSRARLRCWQSSLRRRFQRRICERATL